MISDIFEGTTSLIELKGGYNNMGKEEFTEEDKLTGEQLNLWSYRIDKEVTGVFVRIHSGQFGDMAVLDVDGTEVFIPTLSALGKLINPDNVGHKVKLVYLGERKGKSGRMYGTFDIFVR